MAVLVCLGMVLVLAVFAGPRAGFLLLVGVAIGALLEGFGFGFAGPWRRMIIDREPAGLIAQLLAIALVALAALPLLEAFPGELVGAHAPVGLAMAGGAFVFGLAMQIVRACGSGTLVNAGSGNLMALLVLPFFALGSFLGAGHIVWWTRLGSLPVMHLSGVSGVVITLGGLAAVIFLACYFSAPNAQHLSRRFLYAAALLALAAIVHLVVAGQPWGVVYGLGLWAAKLLSTAGDAGLYGTQISQSVLTDVTSLTNIGLMSGAALIVFGKGTISARVGALPLQLWGVAAIAGLAMGYSSRLAFGCNVGAFFSGISTGSLHGWVWLACAFAGSWSGIALRAWLGMTP